MSFDLYTYIGESNKGLLNRWEQCLEQAGIDCHIPDDYDFSNLDSTRKIKCRLYPPLAEAGTFVDDCDFIIEPMPVDRMRIHELIESTHDISLIEKLKSAQYEVVINTNESDSDDVAMKIICFASAALANAFDGILFDPQEYGAVSGAKVYDVARFYCQPQPSKQQQKPMQEKYEQQKPQEESTVIVRFIFIAIFVFLLIRVLGKL